MGSTWGRRCGRLWGGLAVDLGSICGVDLGGLLGQSGRARKVERVVQVGVSSALVRAKLRLIDLRAGHGRPTLDILLSATPRPSLPGTCNAAELCRAASRLWLLICISACLAPHLSVVFWAGCRFSHGFPRPRAVPPDTLATPIANGLRAAPSARGARAEEDAGEEDDEGAIGTTGALELLSQAPRRR